MIFLSYSWIFDFILTSKRNISLKKSCVSAHHQTSRALCSVQWRAAGHRRRTRRQTRAGPGCGSRAWRDWSGGEACDAPDWCRPCSCPQDCVAKRHKQWSGGKSGACVGGRWALLTSPCLEVCGGGCRRCASCRPWSSASPPPPTATSADTSHITSSSSQRTSRPCSRTLTLTLTPPPQPGDTFSLPSTTSPFMRQPLLFVFFSLPRFCEFPTAASPCCRWSLIFWAEGCWDPPSAGSSRTRPSSCWGHLWNDTRRLEEEQGCLYLSHVRETCINRLPIEE